MRALYASGDKLSDWISAENESKEQYTRLATAALRHKAGIAALWTDPELQSALKWWEERVPTQAWARRYNPAFELASEFLKKSEAQRENDKTAKERQRLEELESENIRRQNARLRRFTIALIFLVLLAIGGGGGAIVAFVRATRSEGRARASESRAHQLAGYLDYRLESEKAAKEEASWQREEAEAARKAAEVQTELAQTEKERADEQAQIAKAEAAAATKAREDLRIASANQLKLIDRTQKELLGKLGTLYGKAISLSSDQETEDQSVKTFEEIFGIYEKDNLRAGMLSTLLLLGGKLGTGNVEEENGKRAVAYYDRALKLFDATDKTERQTKIDTLIRMGVLYTSLKDERAAAARYEQALQEGYEPNTGDTRDVYLNLAKIYAAGQTPEDRRKAIGYSEKQLLLLNRQLRVAEENPDDELKPSELKKAKLELLIQVGSLSGPRRTSTGQDNL